MMKNRRSNEILGIWMVLHVLKGVKALSVKNMKEINSKNGSSKIRKIVSNFNWKGQGVSYCH